MNQKAAKIIFKIAVFVSIIVMFTNCGKRTESLVEGTWIVEDVGQESFPEGAKWVFCDDGTLEVHQDLNCNSGGIAVFKWWTLVRSGVAPYET